MRERKGVVASTPGTAALSVADYREIGVPPMITGVYDQDLRAGAFPARQAAGN